MTHRIYRLRALLDLAGACSEWREFVRRFETAGEVLTAIQADPAASICAESTAVDNVRWFAGHLARRLGAYDDFAWWESRRNEDWSSRLTRTEIARFKRLWLRYADRHGLYEDVEARP